MRKAAKAIAGMIAAATLAGCGSLGDPDLPKGLTKAQVGDALKGCANVVTKRGHYEANTFVGRMPNFFQWEPATYTVITKDGDLIDYGLGTAKDQVIDGEPGLVRMPPTLAATTTAETDARLASASCANQVSDPS